MKIYLKIYIFICIKDYLFMIDDILIKKALLKYNQKLLEDNDSHSWCSPSTNPSQHSFDRFDKYNFIILILGMNKSDTTTQVKVDVTFDCIHKIELSEFHISPAFIIVTLYNVYGSLFVGILLICVSFCRWISNTHYTYIVLAHIFTIIAWWIQFFFFQYWYNHMTYLKYFPCCWKW